MGWIGSALLIVGLWLIHKKKRLGWLLGVFGNAALTVTALQRGSHDFVFINSVMMIINIVGWFERLGENAYWNAMVLPQYRVKWWQIWR